MCYKYDMCRWIRRSHTRFERQEAAHFHRTTSSSTQHYHHFVWHFLFFIRVVDECAIRILIHFLYAMAPHNTNQLSERTRTILVSLLI